jgi:hypothetical protein
VDVVVLSNGLNALLPPLSSARLLKSDANAHSETDRVAIGLQKWSRIVAAPERIGVQRLGTGEMMQTHEASKGDMIIERR